MGSQVRGVGQLLGTYSLRGGMDADLKLCAGRERDASGHPN